MLATAAGIAGCSEPVSRGPVNVIIITLDTTRADHLGCYGNGEVLTPNLDGFAKDGVRFDNCWSTANSTLPSHVSIFTSMYMRDHGIYSNEFGLFRMPELLWNRLKMAGYYTAAFTSGSVLNPTTNINQGFDWFDFPLDTERKAGLTIDSVIRWLDGRTEGQKGGGLFLWVHLFDPHTTYSPPPPYDRMYTRTSGERKNFAAEWDTGDDGALDRFKEYFSRSQDPEYYRNLYKGEVSYMDGQLGRLFDRLKSDGMYDSSLIVVVADHGESLGEHDVYWRHKGIYDVCTRVPLVVKPADGFEPGPRDHLVSTVDIYPTIMDSLGMDYGPWVSGRSLSGILADPAAQEVNDVVYYQDGYERSLGIKTRAHTYIREIISRRSEAAPRKVLRDRAGRAELYDNSKDPGQLMNLSQAEPGQVGSFEKRAFDFISNLKYQPEPVLIEDNEQLKKLRALGYVQ